MGKIERALAECKERGEALEVGNDRLRDKMVALEAELAEAKRTLDENDKIYLHASEVIADRNRLRDAIRRVLPRLVQTHSVYKSLRAALEGGDG